jgi:hypothetical protein
MPKQANIAQFCAEVIEEPVNFYCSDEIHQGECQEAIYKETNEMKSEEVWEFIDSNEFPMTEGAIRINLLSAKGYSC